MDMVCKLKKDLSLVWTEEDTSIDKGMNQRLMGRLIYPSHTCLNIVFIVNLISQFMHSLRQIHLYAAHNVLKYHKGMPRK